jgi:nitrogen regulatory protein P-II 1
MKRIEAIIRPAKVTDVCGALEKVGHPGVMISEIEGHGKQKGVKKEILGKTYSVDLLTKARVEVIVPDTDTEKIVTAIRLAAFTGEIGDGKIFIHPVDDAVRIRTAEQGVSAL